MQPQLQPVLLRCGEALKGLERCCVHEPGDRMTINWNFLQEHWDWAGHIVEAGIIAALVAVLFRIMLAWKISLIVGLAFAAGHFHGREKRDYEVSVHMPPPHLKGYYMWDWSWDGITDFWPTAILCVLVIYLISRKIRLM